MAGNRDRPLDRRTNHTVAAIPSRFNGIEYRSRTEARWAGFFTKLGVPFAYEWDWFKTPEGGYLPDFYLWPGRSCSSWLEIKGPEPIERDYVRARHVMSQTGRPLRFLVGPLPATASRAGIECRHWSSRRNLWVRANWRPNGWTTRKRQAAFDFAQSLRF